MKPELFLEDVGQIVKSTQGKNIWHVENLNQHEIFKGRNLPKSIFVVDFPGRGIGQEFLLSRHLCGPKKFLMIQEIGHTMMHIFKNQFIGRIAQFVILWGGRPLDLLAANPPLYEDHLIDTTYIKLTRVPDANDPKGWRVINSSVVGEFWKDETWLIMEECIASGRTLKHFVDEAFKEHKPKKLFVFPVCASLEGLEGINEVCENHGVEFVPVLNSAIIQVAEQGVSLPFTDLGLQPKTIVTKDFYTMLNQRYQGLPICFVGDIGDSLYKTHDYMIETLSDMKELGFDFSKEDFSLWNDRFRTEEFRQKLNESHPDIYKTLFS